MLIEVFTNSDWVC